MDNLFGKIIRREIPADIVYEDEHVIAIKDINPQAPVHLLIIPKEEEIATLNDAEEAHKELLGHMLLTARDLAQQSDIAERGYRLIMNCNQEGGQTIFQLHLHLVGGRQMLGF